MKLRCTVSLKVSQVLYMIYDISNLGNVQLCMDRLYSYSLYSFSRKDNLGQSALLGETCPVGWDEMCFLYVNILWNISHTAPVAIFREENLNI